MTHSDIVIAGGGLAAATAAESYRKEGGTGSVALLSQEPDPPVHRPPLSKDFLRGDAAAEGILVHPPAFYAEQDIALRLQTRVTSIDLSAKEVALASGEILAFRKLVLATGSRPRRLPVPGVDLTGVHYLRSLQDSTDLRSAAEGARHAVIIGAGFIGMEVAASLTARGVECTVVEMAPRMWARLVPEVVSTAIQRYYEARGVRFCFGAAVARLGGDTKVRWVSLDGGEKLPADLVVAGIGVDPNIGLAREAGLDTNRGVIVDEYLRASHPDVYAIGDIASFPDPIAGRIHVEHWDNAVHTGRAVGKGLAGRPEPFAHVAYFFSDLFDLSLNMIGYPEGWDDVIVRGDPDSERFTSIYVKDGVVRAVLMLNDDAHFDTWPLLVRTRQPVVNIAHRLADPRFDPRNLMLAAAC